MAAIRRPLVELPKLIPSNNQKILFDFLSKNIFVLILGMPQNGNPVPQLVVGVAHPKKNAIFGSLKKRNFWVPRGERLCPNGCWVFHTISNLPTDRVKKGELPNKK